MNILKTSAIFFIVLLVTSCASRHALFVTSTSIAIDADMKVPKASIGYDRVEGYFGPKYEDGSVPTVVASINSDGGIWNPKIKQAYATGKAAAIATSKDDITIDCDCTATGTKGKPMFFGTGTTIGFKLGFNQATKTPEEVVFGFKRQEASYIPLNSAQSYASVLAFLNTSRSAEADAANFSDMQYFATGIAAEQLAASDAISSVFEKEAEDAAQAFLISQNKQIATASEALTCLRKADLGNMKLVFSDAKNSLLIPDEWELDDGSKVSLLNDVVLPRIDTVASGPGTDQDKLAKLHESYDIDANNVNHPGPLVIYNRYLLSQVGNDLSFGSRLAAHKELACGLSQS